MQEQPKATAARWPVYLALALLVIFAVIFVLVFVNASGDTPEGTPVAELTSESYMDIVEPLLANADPERGEVLLTQYDCAACHRMGVANNLAPSFVGIAERAAVQRPPLTAAAYLYEAIIYPDVHVAGSYTGIMPQYYGTRLSEQELGDIIAYLLTPDAE